MSAFKHRLKQAKNLQKVRTQMGYGPEVSLTTIAAIQRDNARQARLNGTQKGGRRG